MNEKQIANQAKTKLKSSLLSKIWRQFKERTGNSLQSTDVKARFSNNQLRRIIIDAPKYIFIQNYGFEGNKVNGVKMRLQAKRTIDQAIDESQIMDYLADNITEIRADEVVAEFSKR